LLFDSSAGLSLQERAQPAFARRLTLHGTNSIRRA
jgi:hypothetical protein